MSEEKQNVVVGRGLVKTFKDFWGRDKVKAIRGIDIDIKQGSIFGLLGPNGAGKSTLIKLILGHLYPSSGRLSVLGQDPRNVETKFKIGYLPERSYLYKNLTAEETLRYFGEILNLSSDQIKNRSEQLLEMVGLQNARKRFVGEFSHGMTRRMGMAQALLNDPDFVILDEPTAGLDPVGCREVKDLIITLGQRGKTVLLTSHLLADVEDVCNELMMIFGGTVQSQGKVGELLADTKRLKIEFPAVDAQTLEQVKQVLKPKVGLDEIRVSSPKQSLENYFLNFVSTSSTKQETAGAQKGLGVAGYLKANTEKKESQTNQTAVIAPAVEPVATAASGPVATAASGPVATPAVEPVATAASGPVATPAIEPVATAAVEPVATPAVEPVATPAVESVATPASGPVATPAVEPVVAPAVESVATPASGPVATPAVEPVVTPAAEPVVTPAAEPVVTPAPESVVTPVPLVEPEPVTKVPTIPLVVEESVIPLSHHEVPEVIEPDDDDKDEELDIDLLDSLSL